MTGTTAPAAVPVDDRGASPTVRLVLPEGWVAVPLSPETARRRGLRHLVRRAVGTGERAALLRAPLRARLDALADEAAAGGAQQLVVSLARTPAGAPLPASLVVTLVATVDAHAAARSVPPDAEVAAATRPGGWCARRVREHRVAAGRDGVGADGVGDDGVTTLAVDYWVGRDGDRHVAVLSFSTPLPGLSHVLLPLFDAVAVSADWRAG